MADEDEAELAQLSEALWNAYLRLVVACKLLPIPIFLPPPAESGNVQDLDLELTARSVARAAELITEMPGIPEDTGVAFLRAICYLHGGVRCWEAYVQVSLQLDWETSMLMFDNVETYLFIGVQALLASEHDPGDQD